MLIAQTFPSKFMTHLGLTLTPNSQSKALCSYAFIKPMGWDEQALILQTWSILYEYTFVIYIKYN